MRRAWFYFRQRLVARLLLPFLWLRLILRWLVYLVSATTSLVSLFLLLVFLWLFVSEPGGGWLLRQAPGVEVEGFTGHLIGEWQAETLSWQGESVRVGLSELDVAWQPLCLLRFAVCVRSLEAVSLDINYISDSEEEEETANDGWAAFRMPEIQLPELSLPWPLTVEQLQLGRLTFNQQEHLHSLQLQEARWQKKLIEWQTLSLQSPWVPLDAESPLQASGSLQMQGDWPLALELQAGWQGLKLQARAAGSLQQLEIQQLQAQGLPLQADLQAALFTAEFPIALQLTGTEVELADFWQARSESLPAQLQAFDEVLNLDHLNLNFSGDLAKGWQLRSEAQLLVDQQLFLIDLDADLDFTKLELKQLYLSYHPEHQARLSGETDWASLFSLPNVDQFNGQLYLDWQAFLSEDFPWQVLLPEPWAPPWSQDSLQVQASVQQGQLSLGGHLATELDLQGDLLNASSQFTAALPLTRLLNPGQAEIRLPQAQEPINAGLPSELQAWLYWAEDLELGLKGQVQGDLERADFPFAASMEYDFLWQGSQSYYQLDLPHFSIKGAREEELQARLRLTSDFWQASLSAHLDDLAHLAEPWTDELQGDLVVTAHASLPALITTVSPVLTTERLQQQLLQGDYRLRTSASHLRWQDLAMHKMAWAFEYSGLTPLPLGQQPLRWQVLSQEVRLGEELYLENLRLHLDGISEEHSLALSALFGEESLDLSLKGGWQPHSEGGRHLDYDLEPFDLESLASFLPDNLQWVGEMQGRLTLDWKADGFYGDLLLDANGGEFQVYQVDEINRIEEWIPFSYQQLELVIALRPDSLSLDWELFGEQLGRSELDLQLALFADAEGQRSLNGHYALENTDLQLLLPFLEVDDISGRLQGSGDIRGYLSAPEVWGEIRLLEVAASDLQWPVNLNRLDALLTLEASQARLSGDFEAGRRGTGRLQGLLDWENDLQGDLEITGQQIDIRVEPWAGLELAPDFRLSLREGSLHLGGTLAIPSGSINIQQLPQQAVRVSSDARVRNRPEPEPPLVAAFSMDIELIIGSDRLQLNAFGLEADLQGRLRVGDGMDTRGELLLVRGTYQSWGQDLRLRRARLNFNGPIDLPFLDIEAIREVQDVLVGVRVTGRIDEPETEIFSEPAMSSENALAWLVLGRPLQTETDENAVNTAALSLGLAGVSDYTRRVGEAVGIREFELATEGEGSDASLVAAGYLSRRLSVRYGVGIYEDISRVAVRYELTRQLYVEVVSSIENSLDIFWEVDY